MFTAPSLKPAKHMQRAKLIITILAVLNLSLIGALITAIFSFHCPRYKREMQPFFTSCCFGQDEKEEPEQQLKLTRQEALSMQEKLQAFSARKGVPNTLYFLLFKPDKPIEILGLIDTEAPDSGYLMDEVLQEFHRLQAAAAQARENSAQK